MGLDQYKVGDLVVFVPPDCVIPNNLIEKYNLEYLKKNRRTGTIKLRGYISQGLILDLPDGNWHEGDDVAAAMGIVKYEPPQAAFYGQAVKKTSRKRINPLFDKYTEIENIKHYPDVLQEGDQIVITEKIHGANSRYSNLPIAVQDNAPLIEKVAYWIKKFILRQEYEFVYGSHNVQITAHTNRKSFYGTDVWGEIAAKYDFKNLIPKDYIIYGELYGDGIQDLTYGLSNGQRDFIVFDVKYKGEYLDWDSVVAFCNQHGLRHVPQLYIGAYYDGVVQKHTGGNSVLFGNQIREGCVTKSLCEAVDPKIGRKILKSISEAYLLRKGGTENK